MPRRCLIRLAAALALYALALATTAEKPRKPKPPLPAGQYPMHITHEGVTIAAEPGDSKDTRPDTRLDYFAHGLLPIRVIVTNDSTEPVNLDDVRIHFIASDDTELPAATADDMERRFFTVKSATGTKLPLDFPIPITVGKKDFQKKIQQDDDDFGFKTTTIAPHTTAAGYLYYDITDLPTPPLAKAYLQLRRVRFSVSNRVIENFEIPLQPDAKAAPAKP
jgi:hypothetical protein